MLTNINNINKHNVLLNAIYKKMCILHVLSLGFRTFRGKFTFR